MAGQIVTCSGCQSKYRTPAQPGQRLQCPKCKAVVVIPSPTEATSSSGDPLGSLDADDFWSGAPLAPVAGAAQSSALLGKQASPNRSTRGKKSPLDPELFPFVKRLAIGIGVVCALIVVTAVGGFFSEPVALAAAIVGLVATLGLALAGRIWFVVIAFKENTSLGVATIFVPLLWTYCLAKRLDRSQLALAVLVSAFIPAILTAGLAGTFQARYTPEGRAATRVATNAENAAKMVEAIRKHESSSPPTGEPREVFHSYADRIHDPARFLSTGDQGLGQFTGYVKGSLQVDETRRRISFQHRGTDALAQQYWLYLVFQTNTHIGPRVTGD